MYDCEHFLPFPDRVGGWKNQRRIYLGGVQTRDTTRNDGHAGSQTATNIYKNLTESQKA